MTDIDDVRACISGSTITCTDEVMHTKLANHQIASVWWQLTDDERNTIAEYAITHFLFRLISRIGQGNSDCTGGVTDWRYAVCSQNAIIRFELFGDAENYKLTDCYYKTDGDSEIYYCYWSGECFKLPVYLVTIDNLDGAHNVCAIQVKEDINNFSSWRFFQYTNSNIQPGNYQMRCGTGQNLWVVICEIDTIGCDGWSYSSKVKWVFGDNCSVCTQPIGNMTII